MIDFTSMEEVTKRLKELKDMKLEHLNVDLLSEASDRFKHVIKDATDEEKMVINEYLNDFCKPIEWRKCIFSEETPILNWGLVHGVATDEKTGLSWKCIHYFNIRGKKVRYDKSLQYHPDGYEIK